MYLLLWSVLSFNVFFFKDDSGECVSTPGFRKSFFRKLLEQFDLSLWYTIDDKGVVTSTPRLQQLTSSVFYHDAEIIEVICTYISQLLKVSGLKNLYKFYIFCIIRRSN